MEFSFHLEKNLFVAILLIIYHGRKMQEDIGKELELQIKGAEKPSVWGLLGVRFILLPYTLGKVV